MSLITLTDDSIKYYNYKVYTTNITPYNYKIYIDDINSKIEKESIELQNQFKLPEDLFKMD